MTRLGEGGHERSDELDALLDAVHADCLLRLRENGDVLHGRLHVRQELVGRVGDEPGFPRDAEHPLDYGVQELAVDALQDRAQHEELFLVPLRNFPGRHLGVVLHEKSEEEAVVEPLLDVLNEEVLLGLNRVDVDGDLVQGGHPIRPHVVDEIECARR